MNLTSITTPFGRVRLVDPYLPGCETQFRTALHWAVCPLDTTEEPALEIKFDRTFVVSKGYEEYKKHMKSLREWAAKQDQIRMDAAREQSRREMEAMKRKPESDIDPRSTSPIGRAYAAKMATMGK